MYANNRLGTQTKATFRTAGGSIYEFSHPFLTGHVDPITQADGKLILSSAANTVNVSSSLRLNDTFFNAQPLQDNALMEVLVDGSTITITNHIMAGRATLQVLPTTNLVKDGDLVAIAPFIMSAKDNVGGVLARRRFVSAGTLTRIYYGVTFANFPHDTDMGNGVPVYPITMLYAGWFEGLNITTKDTQKALWAVGNRQGYSAAFQPFAINRGDAGSVANNIDNSNTDENRETQPGDNTAFDTTTDSLGGIVDGTDLTPITTLG